MAWIWTLFGLNLDTQKVSGDVKHCIKKLSTRSTYLDDRGYQIQWFFMIFGGNTFFYLSWGWRRVENRKKSKIHPGGLILGLSTIYYWWIWWIWCQKLWFWWFLKKSIFRHQKTYFCAKKVSEKNWRLVHRTQQKIYGPPPNKRAYTLQGCGYT